MAVKSDNVFESYFQAEYEKLAEEEFITVSDGSLIRVLRTYAQESTKNGYTLFIVAGFGSVVLGWDEMLLEAMHDFDIIYIETREKSSSVITTKKKWTLDTFSSDLRDVIEKTVHNQDKLILFGSCWGALIISHALVEKKVSPFLPVIIGPPTKLELPPTLRFYYPLIPIVVIKGLKPIAKVWIKKRKAESPKQAAKYIRVINENDPKKWKRIKQRVALSSYWNLYSQIDQYVLLIGAEKDKMHNAEHTKRLATMMKSVYYTDLGTNENTHSKPIVDFLRDYLKR